MRIWLTLFGLCYAASSLLAMEVVSGKDIFQHKCASCHKLPSIGSRTAQQWEMLVAVMQQTMTNRAMTPLSEREQRELLQYLAGTAPAAATEAPISAKDIFVVRCALCHQLPEPTMLKPRQWQAILITMQTRMQQAGIPILTKPETELILEYLTQQASQ